MADYYDIVLLILAGCLGGFVSGLLGVGGGIIFVPILDYFLLKQGVITEDLVPYTLANSFFAVLISGLVGSIPAFKSKSIDFNLLFVLGISAIGAVLLTSYLINFGHWYSPKLFKLVFSFLLLLTLIKTLIPIDKHIGEVKMKMITVIGIGLITGLVSGLSGLGGGIVLIPLFMVFAHLDIKKASTLSLATIPILALPNVLFYAFTSPVKNLSFSSGFIVWPLILPLIIGVLMTVKAGVLTANKMSHTTIKFIFATFIIINILRLISTLI
jgi:uncharacterized membrane protein YfcA